ncbi:pyridoxine/pyridoxamine 5'-phosphate oxidase [Aquimarina sp. MAR_2010_214]|uniref:pyridoxamine 5'-phosphate oxidase family protein n=1 Tax=Aquimarina sp. MAR_2010_214 TaxID=1250026 RepID=UPI000C7101FB|nr:pyridoxamine 5'-phosphate oxidase family protein [Aquimarina sp. MAR_2010_214]PKV52269.1 pyridoxine/pyridoxamine 5'-phosphate oxidase [Aquimarina sp. MAR_2010_214]
MTRIIFSSIINDLKTAAEVPTHPFRYFTLATSDIHGSPRMRTVVLRDIDEKLNLMVYTDSRSKKVTQISEYNSVSLLFLDTERLLQISILAKAEIITNDKTLQSIWKGISPKSRKDYTSQQSPGKKINDPTSIDYLKGKHFFSAIKLIPSHIEYLRLKEPDHLRVEFKRESSEWNSSYLAP